MFADLPVHTLAQETQISPAVLPVCVCWRGLAWPPTFSSFTRPRSQIARKGKSAPKNSKNSARGSPRRLSTASSSSTQLARLFICQAADSAEKSTEQKTDPTIRAGSSVRRSSTAATERLRVRLQQTTGQAGMTVPRVVLYTYNSTNRVDQPFLSRAGEQGHRCTSTRQMTKKSNVKPTAQPRRGQKLYKSARQEICKFVFDLFCVLLGILASWDGRNPRVFSPFGSPSHFSSVYFLHFIVRSFIFAFIHESTIYMQNAKGFFFLLSQPAN